MTESLRVSPTPAFRSGRVLGRWFHDTGGGTKPTYANPGNHSSANAKDVESSADKVTKILMKTYAKNLIDDYTILANGYIFDKKENIDWTSAKSGSWSGSLCYGAGPTIFNW